MKYIDETEWTPFQLMIATINGGNESGDKVFSFLLPRLTKEDMTRTFRVYNDGIEHTFLTYYCAWIFYRCELKHVQSKITRLVEAGSQIDQEVEGGKTALSFLVTTDYNRDLVKWCIETLGANPHKGHLLHYACNFVSRDQHEDRVGAHQWYDEYLTGANTPMAQPDEITRCRPHDNIRMYRYLLTIGLDLEECIQQTGLTPLLAVCSEGNSVKVTAFLQVGGANISLYRKTKEDINVWFWAEFHNYQNWGGGYSYPVRDVLVAYKAEQDRYWKDLMEDVSQTMLQEIQVRDVLQMVSQV
jgi:hypothetical protein